MAGELRGWKEIAAYLGVTDRTAQRWESELNLPVHRLRQRGASPVYALPGELDNWRRSADGERAGAELSVATDPDRGGEVDLTATSTPLQGATPPVPKGDAPRPRTARRRRAVLVATAGLLLALGALVLVIVRPRTPPSKTPPVVSNRSTAPKPGWFQTSADSPFVITLEIVGSDNVKFRARTHGGQAIRVTLPSGAKYGLAPSQTGASVRVNVIEITRGGHGGKFLQTFVLVRGVPQTFTRGSDSFRFQWISSAPVAEGVAWASRQLEGCGLNCAPPQLPLDRLPPTLVEAAEVSSPCGFCCDPEFGACSRRKDHRP